MTFGQNRLTEQDEDLNKIDEFKAQLLKHEESARRNNLKDCPFYLSPVPLLWVRQGYVYQLFNVPKKSRTGKVKISVVRCVDLSAQFGMAKLQYPCRYTENFVPVFGETEDGDYIKVFNFSMSNYYQKWGLRFTNRTSQVQRIQDKEIDSPF